LEHEHEEQNEPVNLLLQLGQVDDTGQLAEFAAGFSQDFDRSLLHE
jgi:hypothetical protein